LLSLISDTYTQDIQITYFIQSFDQRYTKLTLNSLVASLNLTNVSEVTTQAINLVVRTKFLDEPETVQHSSSDHHFTPLDIDYVSNYKNNPDYNRLSQQQQ
jgi:hypothetical protein